MNRNSNWSIAVMWQHLSRTGRLLSQAHSRTVSLFVVSLMLTIAQRPLPLEGRGLRDVPARLNDMSFWNLIEEASESDASFISDNLVSNEMSFAQVLPAIATLQTGGVYVGVGPEQNFTFIAAAHPAIAFVVDIRRDNLRLQLMYKALFELAANRADFLSRLFSRPRPTTAGIASTAHELFSAYEKSAPLEEAAFQRNLRDVLDLLVQGHDFRLTADDVAGIERLYRSFSANGPGINYATGLIREQVVQGTYANIMTQVDGNGRELSYLASEANYLAVKDMEARNLVIPIVGNFAGPKALRSVGEYVKHMDAVVTMFYVSNVEDYLGHSPIPKNGEWRDFCANVATLPLDERSVFIRPLGLAAFSPNGSLAVSSSIRLVSSRDTTSYPAGQRVNLPSPLFPILPEVKDCGAGR